MLSERVGAVFQLASHRFVVQAGQFKDHFRAQELTYQKRLADAPAAIDRDQFRVRGIEGGRQSFFFRGATHNLAWRWHGFVSRQMRVNVLIFG